jgi:hypothetical protein
MVGYDRDGNEMMFSKLYDVVVLKELAPYNTCCHENCTACWSFSASVKTYSFTKPLQEFKADVSNMIYFKALTSQEYMRLKYT